MTSCRILVFETMKGKQKAKMGELDKTLYIYHNGILKVRSRIGASVACSSMT